MATVQVHIKYLSLGGGGLKFIKTRFYRREINLFELHFELDLISTVLRTNGLLSQHTRSEVVVNK